MQLAVFCSRAGDSLEGWGPAQEVCREVRGQDSQLAFLDPGNPGQLVVPLTALPMVYYMHKYQLYRAYIGVSHKGTLGSGYIQLSPDTQSLGQSLGLWTS